MTDKDVAKDIRDFTERRLNNAAQYDFDKAMKRWQEDCDAYALADGLRRYEAWLAAHRARCQTEAAADFEANRPKPDFEKIKAAIAKTGRL